MPRPQQWGDDSDESATESDFVKRAFDEILKRLERSEFSLDDAGAKVFRKDYSSVLRRKVEEDDRNLLHTLAAAPIHKDSHKWLMQLLIKEQPQLLRERDGHKKTPLYIAITRKKKATAVVKTIWEMLQTNEVGEDDFDRLLAMKFEDDQNCIHAAILKGLHPGAIISLVEASSEGTLCAQDTKGRTPLHLAVDYSRCTPEQLEIVKTLISRGDKALDKFTAEPDCYSVFEYHNYTRLLVAPGTGTRADNRATRQPFDAISENPKVSRGNELGQVHRHGDRPAKSDSAKGAFGLADGERITFSKEASKSQESSSKTGVVGHSAADRPNGKTISINASRPNGAPGQQTPMTPTDPVPGILRKLTGAANLLKEVREKDRNVTPESADAIRDYLRLHYLWTTFGIRNHDNAVRFLFGTSTDLQIFFDFSKRPDAIQGSEFLESFEHIKFYDILQYVSFNPVYLLPAPQARENSRFAHLLSDAKPRRGRSEMEFLSRWLSGKGVKQILKVIVMDDTERPHSDESIEKSLKDFNVQILDWRKVDLCPELIKRTCKNVTRLYLQWSGNNTALRAWSEPEGLPMLANLKYVHLNVGQGLESQAKVDADIEAFERRLREKRKDIQVYANSDGDSRFERLVTPSEQRAALIDTTGHDLQSHRWLKCMNAFADMIQNVPEPQVSDSDSELKDLKDPIVVGLIDDGVNNCHPALRSKIHGGVSFHRGDNMPVPYYVTSTGHGTVMASMICRVCPTAKLQVLKLDTYQSEDGIAQITAKSAAQAVEAAVARKVHIISMSWTIQETVENSEDIRRLEKALRKAYDNKILLFCSASDRGAHPDLDYPARFNVKNVFRIGAATADGRVWPMAGDPANMDFILPGHNVFDRKGTYSNLLDDFHPRTGSSVATALAAGLAALILHCARLAAVHTKNEGWAESAARGGVSVEAYQNLRSHEVMRAALRGIGTSEEGQHKFIEVWNRFDSATDKLKKLAAPEDRLEYLAAHLAPALVPVIDP